jgi:DUF4097 and DUF4098 domain-containing protein YvlB
MPLPIRTAFVAVAGLAATATFGNDCKFTADRSAGLDLAGIERVVILAGEGDLEVRGSGTAKRIEVRGKACATSQEFLDQTSLKVRRDGNVATIETDIPDARSRQQAWIDVGIALPATLSVEITDSSGDSELRDLRALQVKDSSGDLRIESIAEGVDVSDSSGEIVIDKAGSVKLQDSSGNINVREVARDVDVSSDSSGDIEIQGVRGRVHIVQDSSGDIRVRDVKGSVDVETDSSGDIRVADIGGDFTVQDDGSGEVNYENVTGRVSVPQ